MTGANRLLIGTGWPLIALLYWWRSRARSVPLQAANAVEIAFLAIASLYAFVIVAKGQIDIIDTVVLGLIFAAYLWRLSRLKREVDEDNNDEEVGPAAALASLPIRRQWVVIAALAIGAAIVIVLAAQPFAESLLGTGRQLGIDPFFLVQWLAPLAGEAPEIVITVLFVLALRPAAALGALISDKINQWTLLVGFIPLFFSLARGGLHPFPLDDRQHEEFLLRGTVGCSLIASGSVCSTGADRHAGLEHPSRRTPRKISVRGRGTSSTAFSKFDPSASGSRLARPLLPETPRRWSPLGRPAEPCSGRVERRLVRNVGSAAAPGASR